jgi:hypothetical protein
MYLKYMMYNIYYYNAVAVRYSTASAAGPAARPRRRHEKSPSFTDNENNSGSHFPIIRRRGPVRAHTYIVKVCRRGRHLLLLSNVIIRNVLRLL